MVEPLKNKGYDSSYNSHKYVPEGYKPNIVFPKKDIKSAVEWLEEEINKGKEPLWYTTFQGERKINQVYLLEKIYEAFEDVMKDD